MRRILITTVCLVLAILIVPAHLIQATDFFAKYIQMVAFLPDGKRVVAITEGGQVAFLDAQSGTKLRTFSVVNQAFDMDNAAISPDGKYLAISSLFQWGVMELATGKMEKVIPEGGNATLAFSPDGKWLAVGNTFGVVNLWSFPELKRQQVITTDLFHIVSATFSPDSSLLLTWPDNTFPSSTNLNGLAVWEVASGQMKYQLLRNDPRQNFNIQSAAFSEDASQIIAGTADGKVRRWGTTTGQALPSIKTVGEIRAIAFSPDGKMLVTGGGDKVRLWDLSGNLLQTLDLGDIQSIKFSQDGQFIIVGGYERLDRDFLPVTHIWEVNGGKFVRKLPGAMALVASDESLLVTVKPHIKGWDLKTGEPRFRYGAHKEGINQAALSMDGRYLLTGSIDQTAILWNANTGEFLKEFREKGRVESVAISSDNHYVVLGTSRGAVTVWDTHTEQRINVFQRPPDAYSSPTTVDISPDNKMILTSYYTNMSIVWDLQSGMELSAFIGKQAAFSRDSKSVLLGTSLGSMWIRDVQTRKVIQLFPDHAKQITSLAFSRDGRFVVSSSWDRTTRVWNTSGGLLQTLVHNESVSVAAISPDGKMIISGDETGFVYFWDVATGKLLHALQP
jgi:WD40 repeat protein